MGGFIMLKKKLALAVVVLVALSFAATTLKRCYVVRLLCKLCGEKRCRPDEVPAYRYGYLSSIYRPTLQDSG